MKLPVFHKKFAILGIVLLLYLILLLPLILINLKKPQKLESKAATASSILYFEPATSPTRPLVKRVGNTFTLNVMLNPGANLPSGVKLMILFDVTKLKLVGSFVPNKSAFPAILQGPTTTSFGGVMVALSIGMDPTKAIQTTTKVGTLTFTALAPIKTSQAVVNFGSSTTVVSISGKNKAAENVLATGIPAYLLITPK